MKKILFLFFGTILTINLVFAQDNCKDILVDGLRDTYSGNSSYYNQMAMMTDLSTMSYNEFKSNFGADITLPIKGIPFTGSMSSDEFKKSQNKLRQRMEYSSLTKYKNNIFVLAANSSIIYAWKDCMKSKQGAFESIVTPIDIEKGIYEYHYHWTLYPDASPTFKGYLSDDNLIVKDPEAYLENGKPIRPNAKSIVMLELKNPKESATFTVRTSLGDKTFHIPGKKYLGQLEVSDYSMNMLIAKLKMPPIGSKRKSWNTPSQPHCTVEADESMTPNQLTINKSLTKLHYTFTCTRKNTRWECDGGWVHVGDDSYTSSATADLDYRDGSLYISNIEFSEHGKDSDCGNLIQNHLQKMNGLAVEIKFIEPTK
ncbi:MAG TPA: hypothetical protein VIN73_05345 [Vicingaceae bacterium]